MSTRVDFALGASNRFRTACEVVRKQYLAGRQLIVFHTDSRALQRFDHLLWGFEPTAFVPHVMIQDKAVAHTAVLLCQDPQLLPSAPSENQWLLNLAPTTPPLPTAFTRILEIVSHQEQDKQYARQRWRQYQQHGYTLRNHQL